MSQPIPDQPIPDQPHPIRARDRMSAYGVHLFTACGIGISAWMLERMMRDDYRTLFLLMAIAVLIDAVDGTLARRFHVKKVCPQIDGRTLDDIVDYINYTFIPLILLCHGSWLPESLWIWIPIPMMCSLFGFAHKGAKEERAGFFRGFPSYWNITVFYVAVWLHQLGPYFVLGLVLSLSLLTILPVRFVYPNRPPRWLPLFLGGAAVWLVCVLVMIYQYPHVSSTLLIISSIYPALYIVLSVYLDVTTRRELAQS